MNVEFLCDSYSLKDEERILITEIANNAEDEAREWLPNLPETVLLVVYTGQNVIPETGETGAALAPGLVGWTVDSDRSVGVSHIAEAELRASLFHEFHHLVRGFVMYGGIRIHSFMDYVVSEGLAVVFERDVGGRTTPWATYPDEVDSWVEELLSLSVSASYNEWMFDHPDGRRWIGYRAGAYIADKAIRASGLSAAELVSTSTDKILKWAPISLADVQRKYVPRIQDSTVDCYIAFVGDRPLGFIQAYRVAEVGGGWWPDERDQGVYGIDQYIAAADDLGRGLGRQMIGAFVEFLFSGNPDVTRIQADPTPDNGRAIRCYEAVGFEEPGIVDTPDGGAMLMAIHRNTGVAV